MASKVPWVLSLVAVAGATFTVTRLFSDGAAVPATDVGARLERLEKAATRIEANDRSLALAGAKLSAAALAAQRPATPDDEGTPEGEARAAREEAERVARETRLYDGYDERARRGGGAANIAQLRKNLEEAKGSKRHRNLKLGAIDCSQELCRVEVQLAEGENPVLAAMAIAPHMGGMSMRPRTSTGPAVMYVAAPGQQLPRE